MSFHVWVPILGSPEVAFCLFWSKYAATIPERVPLLKFGCGFRVLGFWGFGVLGFWGFGVWGFWGFGVLGFWGSGSKA